MRQRLIDLGNTSLKVGVPGSTLEQTASEPPLWSGSIDAFLRWEHDPTPTHWWIASVDPPGTAQLCDGLSASRPQDRITVLAHRDFPMTVEVVHPERLGLDRLAAALAAARLKHPDSSAIVVDAGTATTVDAVSRDGRFLGGAILASPALMLQALAERTRQLPRIELDSTQPPPDSIGRDTVAALKSGAFWGQVGAIETLIRRHHEALGGNVEVFLCGGVAESLEPFLSGPKRRLPGLVLAGIAAAIPSPS